MHKLNEKTFKEHIHMPYSLHARLLAVKEKVGIPMAEFIRRAIDEKLKKHGL